MRSPRADESTEVGVAPSKVLRPRWHRGLLHRARLHRLLQQSRQAGAVTVLSAPAGYGKTIAVADFAARTNLLVVWLKLDESDADANQLAISLRGAILQCLEGAGLAVDGAPDTSWLDRRSARSRAVWLARALTSPPRECLMVLDDFHCIQHSQSALDLVLELLRALPDYVHVIVIGRLRPPEWVLPYEQFGQVAHIGIELLRFDHDETESYLEHSSIPPDEWKHIRAVTDRCEGWPAALTLIARMRGFSASMSSASVDPMSVFDALAEQMLRQLDERLVRFLQRIANLERVVPELCDLCLDATDSDSHLQTVLDMNLFLEKLSDDPEYRLHGLFRSFLQRRAQGSDDFGQHQHLLAATWFRRSGDSVSEIKHLIGAGELNAAADRIDEVAPELTTTGRWTALLQLIERWQAHSGTALPASLARWTAHCQYTLGDWSGAVATASLAIDRCDGHAEELARLHVERSYARRFRGELTGAISDAIAALRLAPDMDARARIDVLRALGTAQAEDLALGKASASLGAAARHAAAHRFRQERALILCDLATLQQIHGQLDSAVQTARQAVEVSDSLELSVGMALARNNLATALHLTGAYVEARTLLARARHTAASSGQSRVEALVWLSQGDLMADLLSPEISYTSYSRALALARELDSVTLESYALRGLSTHHRFLGDLERSRSCLELAERSRPSGKRLDHAMQRIAAGALHIEEGNLALAQRNLEEATELLTTANARVLLARARLFRARVLFLLRGVVPAIDELERLHALVGLMGHSQFLVPEATRMPRLWGSVTAAGRRDLYQSLAGPDLRPRTSPAARGLPSSARFDDPPPGILDAREREVVIALCEGIERSDIGRRLGLSRSTIDKVVSSIYSTTGFRKAYQVVAWANRCGLFSPTEPSPPQIGDPRSF